MKAYLIDPFEKSITEVEYSGDFNDIYKLINADLFDVAYIDDKLGVFVDDEGLFKDNQAFFQVGYAILAGYGLVLGTDDEGNSISPDISLKALANKVRFLTREEVMRNV